MSRVYYNEINSFCAQWLRNLIVAGHLPEGDVDERDIKDVRAGDLAGYKQCHFFAGFGGWPYALKLAGFPDDCEVWTGSCPCQPFSIVGKRKGYADERHLWPAFHALIAERHPATVFGEQVTSPLGREWLAGVRADLEELGYAVRAADLCAAGVGAPHIRQRLYWVALAELARRQEARAGLEINAGSEPLARCGAKAGGMEHAEGNGRLEGRPESGGRCFEPRRATGGMGDADLARPQGRGERPDQHADQLAPWAASQFIACADDKLRRIPLEPAFFPLADGFPGSRVGVLRAAGNAIVPPLAAEFVRAVIGCE